MIFTGERILPDDPRLIRTYLQSLKAYKYAVKFCKGKKVLEVGFGEGYGAYHLSKVAKKVVALDYNEEAVRYARNKYKSAHLVFKKHDFLHSLPKEKEFDVIVSFQVIEHFEDVESYLSKISKLLKKNGVFLVSTPNKQQVSYGFNPYHYHDFSETDLKLLLGKYFKKILMLGVFGSRSASKVKNSNEHLAKSFAGGFIIKALSLFPRKIIAPLYGLGSNMVKYIVYIKEKETLLALKEDDFFVSEKNVKKSLDLLVVCKI